MAAESERFLPGSTVPNRDRPVCARDGKAATIWAPLQPWADGNPGRMEGEGLLPCWYIHDTNLEAFLVIRSNVLDDSQLPAIRSP